MDDLLAVAWEAFLARIAKKRNAHQYADQRINSLFLRKDILVDSDIEDSRMDNQVNHSQRTCLLHMPSID